jgi:DNA polymerase-1
MKITEITKPGELREWVEKTLRAGVDTFAIDFETTGLERTDKIISGAITGINEDDIAYFEPASLEELYTLPKTATLVFHNASFDLKMAAWAGVDLTDRRIEDTVILAHLLNENISKNLGDLVKEYYGNNYKEEFWTKYRKAEDAPKEELREYNALDVHFTLRLYDTLGRELERDGIKRSLIQHVLRLQRTLLETEIAGIAVDQDYLIQKGVELKTRIEKLLPEMREVVRDEIEVIELELYSLELDKRKTAKGRAGVVRPSFSFDSSKQLQKLLYEVLELPPQYNPKTKKISVDYDSLEIIKDLHPVIALIQEYREHHKVFGTYIEGTMERMVDGRIYPSFNVTGTATGRISHSNPNLGNLPRDGGVRGIFIPDPSYVFVSADFSQLEVSLSAHFTRDKNLLRIVNEGASQHDITAAALGIERNTAKTLNFAMQYNCSHFKAAKILGVTNERGKEAYEKYWKAYAGQKRVMDECRQRVDRGEPIESPFGRKRRFEKCTRQPWDSAYRQAWNALVQGTGSDLTSRAFYLAGERLASLGIGRVLFSVHDELIIQARTESAAEAERVLIETMQEVGKEIGLTVPLRAEGSGPMNRWED